MKVFVGFCGFCKWFKAYGLSDLARAQAKKVLPHPECFNPKVGREGWVSSWGLTDPCPYWELEPLSYCWDHGVWHDGEECPRCREQAQTAPEKEERLREAV